MQDITESGIYFIANSVIDKPVSGGGLLVLAKANSTTGAGIYLGNSSSSSPYGISIISGAWTYHAL